MFINFSRVSIFFLRDLKTNRNQTKILILFSYVLFALIFCCLRERLFEKSSWAHERRIGTKATFTIFLKSSGVFHLKFNSFRQPHKKENPKLLAATVFILIYLHKNHTTTFFVEYTNWNRCQGSLSLKAFNIFVHQNHIVIFFILYGTRDRFQQCLQKFSVSLYQNFIFTIFLLYRIWDLCHRFF